ncbi:methyl-accepting chemotaxis protein [Lutispora sp.]|uniref:methyl-accepting chemotaxis protein n=1 Tax=Lutispora sp. TaxID=2828727 RepID=UPI002B1FF396|nr:methyl-accepting chemotaxis protein [Lutispora sp.]MEA4962361.1 methyl-accepting chemotaxis protein [Lutispora sp.]
MKLTVRKKLFLGFGVLIILIVVLGAFSIYNLASVNNELDVLYDMHLKGIVYIKEAQVNLVSLARDRNNLILSTEESEKNSYADSMRMGIENFEKNLEGFNETAASDEAKQRYYEITSLWSQLKQNEEKVIELARDSNVEEAHIQAMNNRLYAERIESEINALVELKNQLGLKAYTDGEEAYDRIRSITMIIIGISILFSIGTASYISYIIARPILHIAGAARMIAEGDLSIQAVKVRNNDEIGELGNSFNRMTEGLRAVIRNVLDASQQVASSSQKLSASSEEATSATQEMASTINQLAIGASKQAEDASAASVVVEQIASSIQQAAENANTVSAVSSNVAKEADSGLGEVQNAVEKMQSIRKVTEESAESVKLLGSESEKIGEIVEVIREISEQTNLLALNAAIEAARAGEQGRGFAVVADEIRKLAEQSSTSAIQIADIIGSIQGETKRVVDVMNLTMDHVLQGVTAVNNTEKYFDLIFGEINNVTGEIQELSASVQQIAGHSQSMNESIQGIASVAEETAASGEEISAASEEQAASMEEVANAAQELAKLSEGLQTNVSRFRL